MPRIGYRLSDKKEKKFNLEKLSVRLREKDIDLIKIDLSQSLEEQGPFDIIIHKVTDVLSRAEEGYAKDKLYAKNFKDFIRDHPECIIIDPLENVCQLLNRNEQYLQVQKLQLSSDGCEVFVPTFVDLKSAHIEENKKKLKDANMNFPFVCKPQVAQGESLSHEMAIIFNEEGLKDVRPPCVAQSFISHNAVLYKVFVVGDEQFICERPSLKNLIAGDDKTIFFNTNDVSTPDATHFLNEMDKSGFTNKPNFAKLKDLGKQIRSYLNLGLFGIDVIIECGTNRYAIIDINLFPGYKGIEGFYDSFERYIIQLLKTKKTERCTENKRSQCLEDSLTFPKICKRQKIQDVASKEFDETLTRPEPLDDVDHDRQGKAQQTLAPSVTAGTNGDFLNLFGSGKGVLPSLQTVAVDIGHQQNGHSVLNNNNSNINSNGNNNNIIGSINNNNNCGGGGSGGGSSSSSPLRSLDDNNNNSNNILCSTNGSGNIANLQPEKITAVNGLT